MILVATSGYSYQDWRGPFYPADLPSSRMLGYYAGHFPFVEVNTTFYRMPDERLLTSMAERTPGGFTFVVKAFQGLTHQHREIGPSALDASFAQFRNAVECLVPDGRLAAILAQFPNAFRNNPPNQAFLKRWRAEMGELPVLVEFRHRSWLTDEVQALLRQERLGFVAVDEPRLPGLLPPVPWTTARPGYVRFHGRNYAKWWRHEASHERYDYRYSEEELAEWVPVLRRMEAEVGLVLVAMNNHFQGSAPLNAKQLTNLLQMS
ncbi:MAG: DUF72 domain-containing protein [Chitinophagales bacterium]